MSEKIKKNGRWRSNHPPPSPFRSVLFKYYILYTTWLWLYCKTSDTFSSRESSSVNPKLMFIYGVYIYIKYCHGEVLPNYIAACKYIYIGNIRNLSYNFIFLNMYLEKSDN